MNLFIEYLNVNKRYGAFFLSLFFLVSKEHAFQLSVHKLTLLVHTNKVVCIYYCQSHNLVGSSAPSLHHCLAEVKQTCEPPKCQSLLRGTVYDGTTYLWKKDTKFDIVFSPESSAPDAWFQCFGIVPTIQHFPEHEVK